MLDIPQSPVNIGAKVFQNAEDAVVPLYLLQSITGTCTSKFSLRNIVKNCETLLGIDTHTISLFLNILKLNIVKYPVKIYILFCFT